ncbi:MAG: nucleoside-diphosphate kinase [Planctomycetota bacterium]
METTLIIIKPDGVARRMIGRFISRFEDMGLQVAGVKLFKISKAMAQTHYAEHKGKPFYPSLLNFITRGPVVVMAVRGVGAVAVCRKLVGATFGANAEAGTIRGDFAVSRAYNLIHGSDSPESAKRELKLYFKPAEILSDAPADFSWVYDITGGSPE